MLNKNGQIALFVIVAIVLVAAIVLIAYFGVRPFGLPSKIAPVESQILTCIQDSAKRGLDIMGTQGGYLSVPAFELGSEYAPFSSQINFFGAVMPYWFYLSGNGIYKEQVPTLGKMQSQLAEFIKSDVKNCDLSLFKQQGYSIDFGDSVNVITDIREDKVFVDVELPITINYQGTSSSVTKHSTSLKSNFGRLYDLATNVYINEKSKLFLEDYTVDALGLYAPGTGVELTCSPKIWNVAQVTAGIKQAIQDNIPTIKLAGKYYTVRNQERKYFVKDIKLPLSGEQINFFYDKNFPTKVTIDPSEGDIMRADPIGNQEGIGVIGFCYVPYHFVYTVTYPVIVQIYDAQYGMFQFPIIVSVENNKPRGAVPAENPGELTAPLCQYKNQEVFIETRDLYGRSVDASISFKCDTSSCPIGNTVDGQLAANFPQCVNGYVLARAENYTDAKAEVSTDVAQSAVIIMKPKHTLDLVVLRDIARLENDESALIVFSSDDNTQSVFYPTQTTVSLSEGNYKVTSYLFKKGQITLQAQSIQKCVSSPQNGVLGLLGLQKQNCFNVEQPAQQLSQITIGGGSATVSFDNNDLETASFVGVQIPSQPVPKTVTDLQDVYNSVAVSSIKVDLK